jgi:prevent-host-death family protein
MKRIAAGEFKARCLAIMDEVHAKRQSVLITKRGKVVAKLVPADYDGDDVLGFLQGKGKIKGDIVSPILSAEEWGTLR